MWLRAVIGPDLALAASAREWPDRLHRHLLDHGGGRVVRRVMGSDQAVEAGFDVLLIDDICSFLAPRLVAVLKQAGSDVVGVFEPGDGPDAKRRLMECGISDVIEADASPEEFLAKVAEVLAHRPQRREESLPQGRSAYAIGVTGACDGVGITEVAVGLAGAVSRSLRAILIDLDTYWPSVAQRLDLPLHPNIRTALDLTMHRSGEIDRAVHRLEELDVVGGVADQGTASPLSHTEVSMLFDLLGDDSEILVVDLGPFDRAIRGVIRDLNTVAVVGTGDPVGVARLLRTVESVLDTVTEERVLLVVNRAPQKGYHLSEIRAEVASSFPDLSLLMLPFDPRLAHSTWEGAARGGRRFARAVGRMAALISESVER